MKDVLVGHKLIVITAWLLTAAFACPGEALEVKTAHPEIPFVYSVENTGSRYPVPIFPAFDKLPIVRPLPDPFLESGGKRATSFADWEKRRNQINAAIEKYEIGPKPDCADCQITAKYVSATDANSTGTLTVTVTRHGRILTLKEPVFLPRGQGSGPFAAMIPMSFGTRPPRPGAPPTAPASSGNFGSLPRDVFANLPVATVDFVHDQVTLYHAHDGDHTQDPFYSLYPELCAGTCHGGVSNSGQYAAWSWGVSRVIDGIEIASKQAHDPLPIDTRRLAVTGCSYAGKMALFAGALDERIALTIAQENGGGGAASWRVSHEIAPQGSVEEIDTTNREWFGQQMWQFAGDNVYKLPEDHDELMDLVAPRALLETGNTDYNWLSNRSNYVSARATQQVYDTLGIGDRFGFFIDGKHPHCGTLPTEAPVIASFVEKFLLHRSTADTRVAVSPFNTLDYKRWTAWWSTKPKGEPQFSSPWISTDSTFEVPLNSVDLELRDGQAFTASYQVRLPGAHSEATITMNKGADVQVDVGCASGASYTARIPLIAGQMYIVAAGDEGWRPDPSVKQIDTATLPEANLPAFVPPGCLGRRVIRGAYLSVLGSSPKNAEPGGRGLSSSNAVDALEVRFACSADGKTVTSKPIDITVTQ